MIDLSIAMHIPGRLFEPRGGRRRGRDRGGSRSPTACGVANVDLDESRVPLLGVIAAFVFAAQMLNFPIAGGTSGHFLGATLAAVLLGPWLACLVMAVVLITQCFAFADGGISALGANILNMGILGALFAGYAVGRAAGPAPHQGGVPGRASASSPGWR